jgi:hypothetical protein
MGNVLVSKVVYSRLDSAKTHLGIEPEMKTIIEKFCGAMI